ncbi:MAG TPA: glycosyltransferase [Candidatus Limnocylindria bacterium]|nr:glycosyltransferase [Candidatus Limnocylindria bacterium]
MVIPLENDCDILAEVIGELDQVMRESFGSYELIFVDDGSHDGTRSFFEQQKDRIANFRYFRLTRPFGFEMAIACGLEQAIGDVIVILNPATDPPAMIPEIAQKAHDTEGVAVGIKSARERSLFYRATYFASYLICRIFLERSQLYGASHFIGLTRTALNALLRIKDSFRYVRVLAMYAGFTVTRVPYAQIERRDPRRQRRLLPLIASVGNLLVSNSDRPLMIAAALSAMMSLANFLLVFYVLFARFFLNNVPRGWASTNFVSAIMFGTLFFVIAIVCQYMAQIRSELRSRPLYVVQAEIQSNVMPGGRMARNIVTHEDHARAVQGRRT